MSAARHPELSPPQTPSEVFRARVTEEIRGRKEGGANEQPASKSAEHFSAFVSFTREEADVQGSCDYLGPPHQGLMGPWGLDSHSKAVPRSHPGTGW